MKKREVYWVNFDPAMGSEIQKERPAVIVSNNVSNAILSRVQVVPLSSNYSKVFKSEALVYVKGEPHKAIADQIRTISKKRVSNRIGKISIADMNKIKKALRFQLEL